MIRDIHVTGYSGPLLSINNVSGRGLAGAATIDPPTVGDDIPVATGDKAYKLH